MTSFAPGTDPRYVEEVNNYFYGGGPKPDAKKWGLPGEFYPSGPDRMPGPTFGRPAVIGEGGWNPPEWEDEDGRFIGPGGDGQLPGGPGPWREPRRPIIDRKPGKGRRPGKGFPGWPGQEPPDVGDDVDNFLREAYQKNLDRDVDEEGRKYWGDQLRSGQATKEDILGNLRRSDEYAGVVENFLSDAYKSNLGRDADDEGFSYWADQLKSGKMDRDAVWSAIRDSDEGRKYQESRPPRDRPPIHGDPEGPKPPGDRDWDVTLPVIPFGKGGQPHPAGPGTRREPRRSGIKDVFTAIGRDNQGRTDEQKDGIRKSAAMLGRALASGMAARGPLG